jgi:hypothetical protein
MWCALSVIVLASQRADGGRWSLLVVVAQFLGATTILVLAVTRGVGGTSRLDLGPGAIAVAGLIGCTVVMMLPKTYIHLLYPAYFVVADLAIIALIRVRRREVVRP